MKPHPPEGYAILSRHEGMVQYVAAISKNARRVIRGEPPGHLREHRRNCIQFTGGNAQFVDTSLNFAQGPILWDKREACVRVFDAGEYLINNLNSDPGARIFTELTFNIGRPGVTNKGHYLIGQRLIAKAMIVQIIDVIYAGHADAPALTFAPPSDVVP